MSVVGKACYWSALVVALGVLAPRAEAQDMAVPVDVQFSLFYRIMSYDRDIGVRSADGLVIGVVYQSRFHASSEAMAEVVRQRAPPDAAYRVRFVALDLNAGGDLGAMMQECGCNVLYIAPLRAVSIATITALTRGRGILTLTGVPAYVAQGFAVGIGTNNDRPEILVNLAASKAEGATFSAQLLRLARVE